MLAPVDRFQVCLAEVAKVEGGWSNHPKDRGGATMAGVTQATYDAYRERKSLPRQSVRLSTEDERRDIYRSNYWWQVAGDSLPPGLDLAAFDFAVNSGPTRATRFLQSCLGVPADGHMGPVTINAANRADTCELIRDYMDARRKYARGLADYRYFGRGWENRFNYIEPAALTMAGEERGPSAQPLADPDAQSASQGRAVSEPKPASGAVVGTVAAAASGTAATVANQTIQAPPQPLVDSVTNTGLWFALGRQCAEFGKFVLANPIEVGVIVAIVAAVWYAPRLLPVIWSRQS